MARIPNTPSLFQALVDNAAERLDVELKSWVKPHLRNGKASIVKPLIAMHHNREGGVLLIGFDDKSLKPLKCPYSIERVREVYHPDKIQQLVSSFTHDPFEVSVHFQETNGQLHPIVCVDEGVTQPAFTKKSLISNRGKVLIRKNAIYVRTLRTNGSPSSALITPADWPAFIDTLVRNRSRLVSPAVEPHVDENVAAIGNAWDQVMKAGQELLVRRGFALKRTYRGLGNTLRAKGLVNDDEMAAMGRLRNLRNLVQHVGPDVIRREDVLEARRLSSKLCKRFRGAS